MKELSIIIPIYNTERYVFECLNSVFRQGLDEKTFEVIIINDGTKDNSMSVIRELTNLHSNIFIIEQENQGLSVARNNGMIKASGEYILMLDSDDLLIDNSIKPLLENALSTQVDMIITDFLQMNDNEIATIKGHHPVQTKFMGESATGHELLDSSLCRFYWRTLYRREFLVSNNITFVPGIYSQDVPFTNECLLKAKKCIKSSWMFIIYRHGHDSVSSSFPIRRAKNMCTSRAKVWELTKMESLSPDIRRKQENVAFEAFCFLISATAYGHLNKTEMFEVVDYLREEAPDIHFHNDFKQILWSNMFRKIPHSFIYMYYIFQMTRKKIWYFLRLNKEVLFRVICSLRHALSTIREFLKYDRNIFDNT